MLQESDVLILGRKTYEKVLSLCVSAADWPYGSVPVIVLTSQLNYSLPSRLSSLPRDVNVTTVSNVSAADTHIRSHGYRKIWVDGGATVRTFLKKNLVDEIVLCTVPVILGSGISLFGGLDIQADVKCETIASELMDGLVATRYRVVIGDH